MKKKRWRIVVEVRDGQELHVGHGRWRDFESQAPPERIAKEFAGVLDIGQDKPIEKKEAGHD